MKFTQTIHVRWVLVALFAVSTLETFARSWRVAQVPNGRNYGCALCHRSPGGGGPRNPFGETVNDNVGRGSRADFWTAALAAIDSDGDGFSNGAEVGDPDGDGNAESGAEVTHPGDADSKPEPEPEPEPPIAVPPMVPEPEPEPEPVPEPEPEAPVDPVEITEVSLSDGIITLSWTGGKGPFMVQRKLGLNDSLWVNLTASAERTAQIPAGGDIGFFRVNDLRTSEATAFTTALSGQHEVPDPVETLATGFGTFNLEGNQLTFAINYMGLTGAATAAHIHGAASTTEAAGVLIDLAPFNGVGFGASGTFSGTVELTEDQMEIVLDGKSYVNIHTEANPAGELRGQIAPLLMPVFLSGAAERPDPVATDATGQGTLFLQGTTLTVNVQYEGLSGEATGAHIHGRAGKDENAGVLIDLGTLTGDTFGQSGQIFGTVELTAEQLGAIIDGQTYVNIHTDANGAGEIRGQIENKQGIFALSASISGLFEVPDPLLLPGSGFGGLFIDKDDLVFTISYRGLSDVAVGAHIHGPATIFENSGVLIDLEPFNDGGFGIDGTLSGRVALNAEQKAAILSGLTYINIHTADNPAGEIRGQIAPVLYRGVLSGAAERPEPVSSSASGIGLMTVVGPSASFNIAYNGLSGPAVGAHLHAPASEAENGDVVLDLAEFHVGDFGTSGGMFSTAGNVIALVPAVVGRVSYVNIHTEMNPPGEIRGQVHP